jgi:aryl-alcohol dehydrogenase-like predicted oxidoreductase
MRMVTLGNTGLSVSRLGFGTVYLGPDADDLSPREGAGLLLEALELGVSFWDTSDDYGSHPHVAEALSQISRERVIVASKARSADHAAQRILTELGSEYLDILLYHEAGRTAIEDAHGALRLWRSDRARGRVRALGLSTHSAHVARLAAAWPEVDVLMLPLNAIGACTPGTYVEDGGSAEMMQAAELAWRHGKGVVAMKVMGCGTLARDPLGAIAFAAHRHYVHSLCIGMRSLSQVRENVRLLDLADSTADEL